jgi:CheY-like chemotaxis protein
VTDRKRRLLVVDDEPDFSNLVRRVGEDLGYEVTVCNRSAQFAAAFEAAEPDVIVLDIVMPEVEGIEIVQWLGQRGTNAKVVVVTGYNPRYAETAKTIGNARGLQEIVTLTKPVRLANLSAVLAP